jgi:hypothetical protein
MNLNKNIFFILIFLLLTGLSFTHSKNSELNTEKEIGPEYFPIDPSLKLIYNSSLGEANARISKVGSDYILDLRNKKFYFVQTVHLENDSIYLTKLDQKVDVFLFIKSSVSVTYNRPYLRFPFPLQLNDSWNWNGVEYIDQTNPDTISVSGKVLGEEMIRTEAGNFNCIKFQIDINKKKSGSHTRFYEWRTPNIGLVKLEAFIDSKGFIGSVMKILGYDEMKFELKKIG